MVSMEIVSFCRYFVSFGIEIMSTLILISFKIILQNLVQIKSMTGRHAKIKDGYFA